MSGQAGESTNKTKPQIKDQFRHIEYAAVVFPGLLGAFTEPMEDHKELYISHSICSFAFPSNDYTRNVFHRKTSHLTGAVFGHLKEFHRDDLLTAFFAKSIGSGNSVITDRPIANVLDLADWIDFNLVKLLKDNNDALAGNAARVRSSIATGLWERSKIEKQPFFADSDVKQNIGETVKDIYNSAFRAHYADLTSLLVEHGSMDCYPNPYSAILIGRYIDDFIKLDNEKSFKEKRKLFEEKCKKNESHSISVSAFCIDQLRHVYDKVYARLATEDIMEDCEEKVRERYTKPTEEIKSAAEATKEGAAAQAAKEAAAAKALFSLESNRTKQGLPLNLHTNTGSGEAPENIADPFNLKVMGDMHVVRKNLTLLLWDVVVERMEILRSNVFSFFLASVAGDEVEAERLTAVFMDMAVPACLAPLFVGINSTSVEPLGKGRSIPEDPKHQRRRTTIEIHYGSVYRTAVGVFQAFFHSYGVRSLPEYDDYADPSDKLRKVIGKFLDAVCLASVPGKPAPKPRGPCFSRTGLLSISDLVDQLKMNFQNIRPLEVVQHRDPSLMGSPSFESRSDVRDFIKPCLFGSSISENGVYATVRKLITAAFESNIAFYYLFSAKEDVKTKVAINSNLFVLMFAEKRLDPLSVFFNTAETSQVGEKNTDQDRGFFNTNLAYRKYIDIYYGRHTDKEGAKPAFEIDRFRGVGSTVWKLKNRVPYRPPSRPASASTVSGSTQKNIVKKVSKSSRSQVLLNSENKAAIQIKKREKKPATRKMNPKGGK